MNTNWNDPNFQGFKGETPFVRAKKVRKPRKAVGTPVTRTIINIVVTLVFAALYFYVVLPALNFKAGSCTSSCCWSAPCMACAPFSPPAFRGRDGRATSAF